MNWIDNKQWLRGWNTAISRLIDIPADKFNREGMDINIDSRHMHGSVYTTMGVTYGRDH